MRRYNKDRSRTIADYTYTIVETMAQVIGFLSILAIGGLVCAFFLHH
jgi:hypothetical protein